MNLGRYSEARILFLRALDLDEENAQAQEFLTQFFNYKQTE